MTIPLLANKLMELLTQAFGTSLVFAGVATQPEDVARYGRIDMVLTTVELAADDPSVEVVNIHPFLNEKDRLAVQRGLDRVVRRKKRERVRRSLLDIANPELFVVDRGFANEREAIAFMAGEMIAKGYADPSFLEAVFERERSYSTAYGDVAVPHSLQMNAKKTGVYVSLNDRPVPWGGACASSCCFRSTATIKAGFTRSLKI